MGAAAAAQNVLRQEPSEANDDIALMISDRAWGEPCEAPQTQRPPQRDNRNDVTHGPLWRGNTVFAAKQMHFMAEITQSLGSLKKISFRSAFEIQAFMNQGDFHRRQFS